MYGSIIGDIAGSRFEFNNIKTKDFVFFNADSRFTDDTVMTIAVAKALHESKKNKYVDLEDKLRYWMRELATRYPNCGFGRLFHFWAIYDGTQKPYNSFGNGSAMRTSECAFIASSLKEAQELARRCASVSHNHPEGIKGAEATTSAAYLARIGKTKKEIKEYIEKNYYPLDFTIDSIREEYTFNETCQGSVPQAIKCFLESENYEDAIRNCVSIGGDCDTTGAICGCIAEAYYGIPKELIDKAKLFVPQDLQELIDSIYKM